MAVLGSSSSLGTVTRSVDAQADGGEARWDLEHDGVTSATGLPRSGGGGDAEESGFSAEQVVLNPKP